MSWKHASGELQAEMARRNGVKRRAAVADRDRAIIRASAAGATQRALAARFGISRASIRHVLKRDGGADPAVRSLLSAGSGSGS